MDLDLDDLLEYHKLAKAHISMWAEVNGAKIK